MPAVPVPETGKVSSFWVRKTCLSIPRTSSISLRKTGSRCPRVGRVNAWRILGSMGLGPGPSSSRLGGTKLGGAALMDPPGEISTLRFVVRFGEQLDGVQHLDGEPRLLQAAADLQDAAGISRHERVAAALLDLL